MNNDDSDSTLKEYFGIQSEKKIKKNSRNLRQ